MLHCEDETAQALAHQEKWIEAKKIAGRIAAQYPDFEAQYEVDYLLGRCLARKALFHEARRAYQRVTRSGIGGKTETAAMAQWMGFPGPSHPTRASAPHNGHVREP